MKRINKWKTRIKIKIEKSIYKKYMTAREELKRQKKLNEGLKHENHQLIDLITLKNIEIRELKLGERN